MDQIPATEDTEMIERADSGDELTRTNHLFDSSENFPTHLMDQMNTVDEMSSVDPRKLGHSRNFFSNTITAKSGIPNSVLSRTSVKLTKRNSQQKQIQDEVLEN